MSWSSCRCYGDGELQMTWPCQQQGRLWWKWSFWPGSSCVTDSRCSSKWVDTVSRMTAFCFSVFRLRFTDKCYVMCLSWQPYLFFWCHWLVIKIYNITNITDTSYQFVYYNSTDCVIDVSRLFSKLCQMINKMAASTHPFNWVFCEIMVSDNFLYDKNLRVIC